MSATKILLVSYVFPPAGGISVQRILSFARYLPEHGFDVHVLAAKNPTTPTFDASLLANVPASVKIHRTITPEVPFHVKTKVWNWLSGMRKQASAQAAPTNTKQAGFKSSIASAMRQIFCPDPEVVWVPFALRRARQVVKHHAIDVVLVTAPPFSSFLIGNALKHEFPHITLVSDFRDDWLRFYLNTFDFQSHARIRERAEQIERDVAQLSDRILCVTPSLVEDTRARYRHIAREKFVYLSNGYDPAVFAGFQPRERNDNKIVITYTGTVYSTTSARYFLDGVELLPPAIRDRLELRFVGRIAGDEQRYFEDRRCAIKQLGFLPQSEAIRYMEETDYLLVTMLDPTATSGKIFEYLSTGKPIIAVGPQGEISRLLAETGSGFSVDHTSAAQIASTLEREFQSGRRFTPNWKAIHAYARPHLTEALANVISECREEAANANHPTASHKSAELSPT